MLQWMGGSRKRIKQTKKSLQNRQKKFFEQRRRQEIEASAIHKNNDDRPQSLDLLGLEKLCSAFAPLYGSKKAAPLPDTHEVAEARENISSQRSPSPKQGLILNNSDSPRNTIKKSITPVPRTSPVAERLEKIQKKNSYMDSPSRKRGFTLLDVVDDDLETTGKMQKSTCSFEGYAAFALDGIGVAEMRTPHNIRKKRCSVEGFFATEKSAPHTKKRRLEEGLDFNKQMQPPSASLLKWDSMFETRETPDRIEPRSIAAFGSSPERSGRNMSDLSLVLANKRTDQPEIGRCFENAKEWDDFRPAKFETRETPERPEMYPNADFEKLNDHYPVTDHSGLAGFEIATKSLHWNDDNLEPRGTPERFTIAAFGEMYPEPTESGQQYREGVSWEEDLRPPKQWEKPEIPSPRISPVRSLQWDENLQPGNGKFETREFSLAAFSPVRRTVDISCLSVVPINEQPETSFEVANEKLEERETPERFFATFGQMCPEPLAMYRDDTELNDHISAIKPADCFETFTKSLQWDDLLPTKHTFETSETAGSFPIAAFVYPEPSGMTRNRDVNNLSFKPVNEPEASFGNDTGWGDVFQSKHNCEAMDSPVRKIKGSHFSPVPPEASFENAQWEESFPANRNFKAREPPDHGGQLHSEPLEPSDVKTIDQPEASSGGSRLMVYTVSLMTVQNCEDPEKANLSLVPVDNENDRRSGGHSLTTVCRETTPETHAISHEAEKPDSPRDVWPKPEENVASADGSQQSQEEDNYYVTSKPASGMYNRDGLNRRDFSGDPSSNYVEMLESYILQLKCINKALLDD